MGCVETTNVINKSQVESSGFIEKRTTDKGDVADGLWHADCIRTGRGNYAAKEDSECFL